MKNPYNYPHKKGVHAWYSLPLNVFGVDTSINGKTIFASQGSDLLSSSPGWRV